MLPHLLFLRAPAPLPRTAASMTGWPKFGMSCILSDVAGCIQGVSLYTRLTVEKNRRCAHNRLGEKMT